MGHSAALAAQPLGPPQQQPSDPSSQQVSEAPGLTGFKVRIKPVFLLPVQSQEGFVFLFASSELVRVW